MKVILQQDVARLGKKFAEVEVSDGYALNRLIPGGMAVPANKTNRNRVAKYAAQAADSQQAAKERLSQAVAALQTKPLVITASANEQGGLFKAIDAVTVADTCAAQGLAVDESMVVLPEEAIKQLGEHTITLQVGSDSSKISLVVVADT